MRAQLQLLAALSALTGDSSVITALQQQVLQKQAWILFTWVADGFKLRRVAAERRADKVVWAGGLGGMTQGAVVRGVTSCSLIMIIHR